MYLRTASRLSVLLLGSLTPAVVVSQQGATLVRPPIIGVASIQLRTDNLEAARQFYSGLLGLQEPARARVDGTVTFKVNDGQYIQLFDELKDSQQGCLIDIAFETTDAEGLRAYLASKGVKVLEKLEPVIDGELGFHVVDPDGHQIGFVQYVSASQGGTSMIKAQPNSPISRHMIHVGFIVHDRAAEDRFYKDILGFKETWHGGMKDDRTDWIDMRLPDGKDWLEYMLNVSNPDPHTMGVMNHLALGVPDVNAANQELIKRGFNGEKSKIGRDGKWQLNLYDPSLTRVELMEPKPVEKPCCSPIEQ